MERVWISVTVFCAECCYLYYLLCSTESQNADRVMRNAAVYATVLTENEEDPE
jgi:hypothetical protein